MGAKIDIANIKYGLLTALERSKERSGFWRCICDCGTTKEIYGGHLRAGYVKSCGCLTQTIENIIGENFGYLCVKKYLYSHNQHHYWECLCICGEVILSTTNNLKRKNTRSCGCMATYMQEKTNIEKYGTKSSFQNEAVREKFRNGNMQRYGVAYPAQNAVIALKTARAQKNSFILYHWKTNAELVCTASYEKRVVEYLNRKKIDFKWQHKVFNMFLASGKHTTYRPDCYIIGRRDPWVEIKGYFRGDAEEKWNIFSSHIKPNSELWDKKKLKALGIL